jgi:hypothetical protein
VEPQPADHPDVAALNPQRTASDQRQGDLAARPFEDPAEGRAGDFHPPGGFFLIQSLVIGQAERLEFVERQHHFTAVPSRSTSREE